MIKKITIFLMALLALIILCQPMPAKAAPHESIEVVTNQASIDFPKKVLFTLNVKSDAEINTITLAYGTERRSCTGQAQVAIDFTAGTDVHTSWSWDLRKSGDLPPGAIIWWQWLVTDANGNRLDSEIQTIEFMDPNYTWKQTAQGGVTILWAEGPRSFGENLLTLSLSAIERLQEEAGISPIGEVRLTIYPSSSEMIDASVELPDWAGGRAFPEYNMIVAGIAPTELEWAAELIPHEIGHLVTFARTFNCLGVSDPTWLNEGISMVAEGNPLDYADLNLVKNKLRNGLAPTLRSLAGGFSGSSDKVHLAYVQSELVVRFLIDEYGAENLAGLLAEIQAGNNIDKALWNVYGFDTDGLDSIWRISLGFDPLPGYDPNATPTPQAENTAVPTLSLWVPQSNATATPSPQPTPTPTPEATLEASATPQPSVMDKIDRASLFTYLGIFAGGLCVIGIIVAAFVIIVLIRRKNSSKREGLS